MCPDWLRGPDLFYNITKVFPSHQPRLTVLSSKAFTGTEAGIKQKEEKKELAATLKRHLIGTCSASSLHKNDMNEAKKSPVGQRIVLSLLINICFDIYGTRGSHSSAAWKAINATNSYNNIR